MGSSLKNTRVLVTGGAGYIGSHVVLALAERGARVTVYDNLSTGHKAAVLGGDLVVGDLADRDRLVALCRDRQPQAVLHFAASIVVPESVRRPLAYYRNNVVHALHLLEAMEATRIPYLIFSSSAAVYGIPEAIPIPEEAPLQPINPYGETKATVERMLRDWDRAAPHFRYVSLRYFNVAGADPDGRLGPAYPEPTHLIIRAVKAARGTLEEPLTLYGTDYPTPDGTCIRDYIHVTDLAEAHVRALEYLLADGPSGVFNCGYGRGYSVREVLETVRRVTGVDFPVVEGPRRAGDPPALVARADRIREVLDWTPRLDDLETIVRTAWVWECAPRFP